MNKKKISRRVAVGAMAVTTASLVVEGRVSAMDRKSKRPIATKKKLEGTLEEFFWQNAVSERFAVSNYSWLEAGDCPKGAGLVLHSVSRVVPESKDAARPRNLRPYAISLMFEGEGDLALDAASYRVVHPAFGNFDLLLSKTLTETGVTYYEAVLN